MKRTILILVMLTALVFCAACAEAGLEGPGFDTPEDAVLAYLEGMNQGDVSAMLSTFAFETLAARADPVEYLERQRAFIPEAYLGLPVSGDYARALVAHVRYGSLAKSLCSQYVEFAVHNNNAFIHLKEEEAMTEFLEAFDHNVVDSWRGNVEFVGWISPSVISQITNGRSVSSLGVNILKNYAFLNADDFAELAAHIRLNGTDAVQLMQCVRYGDRWYNRELNSIAAMMLNLNSSNAGMAYPFTDADRFAIGQAIQAVPDEEELLYLSACRASDLAGSRWRLDSVSDASVTVVNTPEETQETARSAFAELHFIQMGSASAQLWAHEDIIGEMDMAKTNEILHLVWTEMDGRLISGIWNSDIVSDSMFRREGDALVAVLNNGLEATFRRVN